MAMLQGKNSFKKLSEMAKNTIEKFRNLYFEMTNFFTNQGLIHIFKVVEL